MLSGSTCKFHFFKTLIFLQMPGSLLRVEQKLFLEKGEHSMCTYLRLRPPARCLNQVVETVPITTSEAVVQGGVMTRTITNTCTSVTTSMRTVTQIIPGNV